MMLIPVILAGLVLGQAPARQALSPEAELIESAKLGRIERATELLSGGASVNTRDRRGFTPLMWAAANGETAMVRQFLDAGAAPDARAPDGTTALLLAAGNGSDDIVRVLVTRGASITASRGGLTARQLAEGRGHANVVTMLEQAEILGARLLKAAAEGHDTLVRQLLAAGAPINVADERGATPLMMSARNGDLGILQALLSRGADASARDQQGQTVIEWAEPSPTTGKYVLAFLRDRGLPAAVAAPAAITLAPQVKASLQTLAGVLSRVPASGATRPALVRANTALGELQALSAKWPADSPADYRENLAGDVRALEAAVAAGDVKALAETVQLIADDLEVKLEHCTRSGGKLGGAVLVRVRTVQAGTEIRSWQVFYMPRIFESAANASPDLFPQLSSPTEEALVPGRYVMWVRDPTTSTLGERTTVKVGEGKKDLLVDLPVPPASPQ